MNYVKLVWFIGVDISKAKLNIALRSDNGQSMEWEIENRPDAISLFLETIQAEGICEMGQAVFCMEHTGIYSNHLLSALKATSAFIAIEHATKIKYSSGIQRGKDDVLDARLIAEYAQRFTDRLKEWTMESNTIKELKALHSLRRRLVGAKKQLEQPLDDLGVFMGKHVSLSVSDSCTESIKAIRKDIKAVDEKLYQLIRDDAELKQIYKSATSVTGIGKITATEIIIRTNGFKNVKNAKSLACYAGLAPFRRSSGSSLNRKPKVSKKANAELKSLLFMGAKSAILHDENIKRYFEKKIAEGKHYMSAINAVKNKMIHRLFAVVKNKTTYQKNYDYNLEST